MCAEFLSAIRSNHLPMLLDKVIEFCPSVASDISVAEAIAFIYQDAAKQTRVNAVVINNSIPIGILTDVDIVRQIAAGKNLEFVRVADAVTQPLATLPRAQIKNINCILDKFDSNDTKTDNLLILDKNGEIEGVITKTSIIPALKDILLEQENSSMMMQSIFNTVSDGIFIYDIETGRLVEANPAAYKMHGYSYEEILIAPATQYIHKNSHNIFTEFVETVKSGNEYYNKATGVRKDGSAFDGEIRGTKVNYNSKMFAIAAITDTSTRRCLEIALQKVEQRTEELANTNAELARATRMKDEFLANMSHELRTPLNAVLGLSEGLLDEVYAPLTIKQKKAVSSIKTCGQHLLELINDILDLAKIESGKLEINKTLVNINTLCSSIWSFIKQQASRKNIQLSFKIASDIDKVWIDELRIRQVLINLLSNAIKFTLNGGSVKLVINADKEAKQIYFRVDDTGIGIDASNLSKLFQPFVQIESSLSRKYPGTGLGLALVQKIACLHAGSVTVSSEVDKGSSFTVTLPYITTVEFTSQPTEPTISAQDTSNSDILLNRPLILIADDNPTNAELMSEFLVKCAYQPIVVCDGLEAVQLATLHKPQLIIMDVQMPQLDGLTAIQRIREVPELSQIPIIALTALSTEDKQRCIEAGASEFLNKPVSLKYLNSVIKKLLDRSYKS